VYQDKQAMLDTGEFFIFYDDFDLVLVQNLQVQTSRDEYQLPEEQWFQNKTGIDCLDHLVAYMFVA
jgi:hypothetical protein